VNKRQGKSHGPECCNLAAPPDIVQICVKLTQQKKTTWAHIGPIFVAHIWGHIGAHSSLHPRVSRQANKLEASRSNPRHYHNPTPLKNYPMFLSSFEGSRRDLSNYSLRSRIENDLPRADAPLAVALLVQRRITQNGPNMGPRWTRNGPRWAQRGPNGAQLGPKWAPTLHKWGFAVLRF
jgi:hypothetical protein